MSHADLIQFARNSHIDDALCFEVDINNKNKIDQAFNSINAYVVSSSETALADQKTIPEKHVLSI